MVCGVSSVTSATIRVDGTVGTLGGKKGKSGASSAWLGSCENSFRSSIYQMVWIKNGCDCLLRLSSAIDSLEMRVTAASMRARARARSRRVQCSVPFVPSLSWACHCCPPDNRPPSLCRLGPRRFAARAQPSPDPDLPSVLQAAFCVRDPSIPGLPHACCSATSCCSVRS